MDTESRDGWRRPGVMRAGLLAAGLVTGCLSDKVAFAGDAVPPPAGTLTRQILDRQAAKGRADAFVIYLNEWHLGGTVLGPYGKSHLDQVARRLADEPATVVIQPEAEPALNQVRQQAVILYLAEHGVGDAATRVVVGCPQAEGLYGECEAERAFHHMLHPPAFPLYGAYGSGAYGGFGTFGAFSAFRGY